MWWKRKEKPAKGIPNNTVNSDIKIPHHLGFEKLKSEVEDILKLDFSENVTREKHGEQVITALKHLDEQITLVWQQANGYPLNPINAGVWMDRYGYVNLAFGLTQHFKKFGWLKREENASMLWAKATLAVCSHYHHMVGPAMLANADCHERLESYDRAIQMYSGVVRDFVCLLEIWGNEPEAPTKEDKLALESLETSIKRLLAHKINHLDDIDLNQIQAQTQTVLSRSKSGT